MVVQDSTFFKFYFKKWEITFFSVFVVIIFSSHLASVLSEYQDSNNVPGYFACAKCTSYSHYSLIVRVVADFPPCTSLLSGVVQ
jgi:hypothetical protein